MKDLIRKGLWAVMLLLAMMLAVPDSGHAQSLSAVDMTVQRGQSNAVAVVLNSSGEVGGMGFTLLYDTNLLTFARSSQGAGAAVTDENGEPVSVSFNRNTNTPGRIAFAIAVSAGYTFQPGPRTIVNIFFRAAPGVTTVTTPVIFVNEPIATQLADVNAETIPFTKTDALVTVAGACSYTLSTDNASFDSAGGSGAFQVNTTSNGCPWNVVNTNSWITIEVGASGTGSGPVGLTVAANPSANPRTGVLTVEGATFTVTQAGAASCVYTLSPTNRNHGYGTATNSIVLSTTSGCSWTVVNTNAWIAFSVASGTGSNTLNYSVLANPTLEPRTGVVVIAGQVLTIGQNGAPCLYTLSTNQATHGAGAETNVVSVATVGAICNWSVDASDDWIVILSNKSNNSGNGDVTYAVKPNLSPAARTGLLTIASQVLTVSQAAGVCVYKISPVGRSHGSSAASNIVTLTASNGCPWTVVNTNDWITIADTNLSGTGGAIISYGVAANNSITERVGTVLIADQTLTITQRAVNCTFSLSPTNRNHGYGAATNTVNVSGGSICPWTVVNTNDWITIQGGTNMLGSGSFTYILDPNPESFSRTGRVQIGSAMFTLVQTSAPCSYALSPHSGVHTTAAGTGQVTVTAIGGCSWSVVNTNPWIAITAGESGVGSGIVHYSFETHSDAGARSGTLVIAGINYTVSQGVETPCTFKISPVARTHGTGSASNIVTLTTSNNCNWMVVNTNSWITIALTNLSGTGSAIISYGVAANNSVQERWGSVLIANQVLTINQRAVVCTYSLSPTNRNHGYGAATNTVNVSVSGLCPWTVVNTNDWITIQGGTNMMGNGSFTYMVEANPSTAVRTGLVQIASATFTLIQTSAPCSYALSPTNGLHSPSSETGQVSVTASAECNWAVVNTNSWITILSGNLGTGSGLVTYSVETNSGLTTRSGVLLIGGQKYPVSQSAFVGCSYKLSAINRQHGPAGASNFVTLTTSNACEWTLVNTNDWITILSPTNGFGSATISYLVDPNLALEPRTGAVTIADQTLTLAQRDVTCEYSLSPTNRGHGFSAATNSVSLSAPSACSWAVVNTNDWITFLSATSGTGNASISYTVDGNVSFSVRTGVVQVADQVLTIVQDALVCNFSLSPTNRSHGFSPATNSLTLTTGSNCPWTLINTNDWIDIHSATNGTGNVSISYAVLGNPTLVARTGSVQIASETLTIIQQAVSCDYTLSPTNRAHGPSGATNSVSLNTAAPCPWTVINTNEWLTITSDSSGTGTGTIGYIVAPNTSLIERTGIVQVADQILTIVQRGVNCEYSLSPTNRVHGFGGATNSVTLSTGAPCPWTVHNTNEWITITSPLTGTGATVVEYTLSTNLSLVPRTGVVQVAEQVLTIVQQAVNCQGIFEPLSRVHSFGAATNVVALNTPGPCEWTIVNTNEWITVAVTSGQGSSNIAYSVAFNSSATGRTGEVRVGTASFTVEQIGFDCQFVLAPQLEAIGPAAYTNLVEITTTSECPWTVLNTNDWIIILGESSGVGSGSVSWRALENSTAISRSGSFNIADQQFTVSQNGTACSSELSAQNATFSSHATNGEVKVTTPLGCLWTVVNTNNWITLVSFAAQTNNGTVLFTIASNETAWSRSGVLSIADQNFTVTQTGAACFFTLSSTTNLHGFAVTTNSVNLSTLAGCSWTIQNTNEWITITSPLAGTGATVVAYSLTTNMSLVARTGLVQVTDQFLTVVQEAVGCQYTLAGTNQVFDFGAATGQVFVTTFPVCAWEVVNTNSWISILSSLNPTGSGTVSFAVASNETALARNAAFSVAGQEVRVTQSGAACEYQLSAASAQFTAGLASGSVHVTTPFGCEWTVENTNAWITITSALNNTNGGSVSYTVASNSTALGRSGAITIAGLSHTVTQAGAACQIQITSAGATFGSSPSSGSVGVTTLLGCAWTVENTNAWVAITSSLNNTNSGTVTFTVASNQTALTRSGVLTVGGQNYTVTQTGAACTFALSTNSASFGPSASAGSVHLTTLLGCSWTVENTNTWITVTSPLNDTNSGVITYLVASNQTALSRSGAITIAGQSVTITQSGAPCSYTLSASGASFSAAASNSTVNVTTLVGCVWAVENTNSWIVITTALNNTNSGAVSYTVASNQTALSRSGVITIGGQMYTVSQSGAGCAFTLLTNGASFGPAAGNGTINLTTLIGCTWTIDNTNSWILITSSLNHTNSGAVSYTVTSNQTSLSRSGVITVAGQNFTVTQSGAACSYILSGSGAVFGPAATNAVINVTTLLGCAWTVVNTNSWITITSSLNNTNSGAVSYTVGPNQIALSRSGVIVIAGQSYTVTQEGVPCDYTLSASSASLGYGAANLTVSVTTTVGCTWAVENTNSWIHLTSSLNHSNSGLVTLSVVSNASPVARTGILTIAGKTFTVNQAEAPCSFAIQPNLWIHRAQAETGMVGVATHPVCAWTVSTTNEWITLTSSSGGIGNGSFAYSLAANTSGGERSGVIRVHDQVLAITQLGTNCFYKISPTNRIHGFGSATNTIAVTASNGCSWMVINTNSWLTVLTNASGSGSTTITYTVTANRNPGLRAGWLNIAGEILTLTQWGTNCGFILSPSYRTHGGGAQTGAIAVTASSVNCAWNVENTNSWISFNAPASGTGTGVLSYALLANNSVFPRAGTFTVGGETFTVSQTGVACTVATAPGAFDFGAGPGTGTVQVTAPHGCGWAVTNSTSWIMITSGTSGSGDGAVTFQVLSNQTFTARSGSFTINDQVVTIIQAGTTCDFVLSASGALHRAGAETGTVQVASSGACNWTVVNTNSWMTLLPPVGGNGNGTVTYAVEANNSLTRTGVVVIAGVPFSVTQGSGIARLLAVDTSVNRGQTNSVMIVLESSGYVNGLGFNLAFDTNILSYVRASRGSGASVIIDDGGELVTINPTLVINTNEVSSNGHVGFAIAHQTGVAFNPGVQPLLQVFFRAAPGALSLQTPVTFTDTPLTSQIVNIGAQILPYSTSNAMVSVLGSCVFTLSTNAASFGASGGSGFVEITANNSSCAWFASSTHHWVSFTSVTNGTGNANVSYTVAPNPGFEVRTAVLNIAGRFFTINQAGTTCSYLLSPASRAHSFGAETGLVSVVTSNGCAWIVSNTNGWITLRGSGSGNGSGNFGYVLSTNQPGLQRTGQVFVAGQAFTVVQAGAPCSFGLIPSSGSFGAGLTNSSFAVSTVSACPWNVVNTNAWITILSGSGGTGSGTVTFQVAGNQTSLSRSGNIVVMDKVFTVSQAGVPCNFALSTASGNHNFASATGQVSVLAPVGCAWSVSNSNSWITVLAGATGSGTGVVTYAVNINPNLSSRTGVVNVAGLAFPVVQAGNPCAVTLTSSNRSHNYNSETGQIAVVAGSGCSWTVSNTNGWISVLTGSTGTGSGSVTYTVGANPGGSPRSGYLDISGKLFLVSQAPSPCAYAIAPMAREHGPGLTSNTLSLATFGGCAWNVYNTNSWIQFSQTNGIGGGSLPYTVQANPTALGRTGLVFIADQVFTITQGAAPCTFTLSATNLNHGYAASTGSVSVASVIGCNWSASSPASWIHVNASSFTNNGTVVYTLDANMSGLARTGVLSVAQQNVTIIQSGAPCTFSLSANSAAPGYNTSTGTVTVNALFGCAWGVSNTNGWISVVSGNGSGTGVVTYVVQSNATAFARTGFLSIQGQFFAITQAGGPCDTLLSSPGASFGYAPATGSVSAVARVGCSWAVQNSNSWITVTSPVNNNSSGTVTFTVATNSTALTRTGVLVIGGQSFTVTQSGVPCFFALSTTNMLHLAAQGTGTVALATAIGCEWQVSTTNNWITILSGVEGSSSSTISYRVEANESPSSRTGTVIIANQTLTLIQSGIVCTYAVTPTNSLISALNQTVLIGVETESGCYWETICTNDWVSVRAGTNAIGNGVVRLAVAANPNPSARTAQLLIAGRPYTLTQTGVPCSYSLLPESRTHLSGMQTGAVSVLPGSVECSWTAATTNSWITILSGSNGVGNATLTYSLQSNPSPLDRTGWIAIGNKLFQVTQLASACQYVLAPTNRVHGTGSETGLVTITTGPDCPWTVSQTDSWITILSSASGSGSGSFTYAVQPNFSPVPRVGVISISGEPFTVTQAGIVCSFAIAPTNAFRGSGSETGLVTVTTSNLCPWTIVNTNSWITFSATNNLVGNTNLLYVVSPNPGTALRSGTVLLAGRPLTVLQAGIVCSFSVTPSSFTHQYGAETGQVSVTTQAPCNWNVLNTNSWITILTSLTNTGSGVVRYAVARNTSPEPRTGVLTIAGQPFTVTHLGVPFVGSSNKTVECNSGWSFDLPQPTGLCIGTNNIVVLSTTTNFLGACGSTFRVSRVWEASDACGYRMSFTQIVQVVDTIAPVITCSSNKVVEFGFPWNFDTPTALDFCGGTNVTIRVVSTVTNADCGRTFTATRTWSATDGCANASTCSQTVQVIDTTPPFLNCPSNKIIVCGSPWTFDTPLAGDIADGTNVNLVIVGTLTNGSCGQVFSATRIWRATDQCGNSVTCNQTVMNSTVVVGGTVYYPLGYPSSSPSDKRVSDVLIHVSGTTNTTLSTGGDGGYLFTIGSGGNAVLSPSFTGGPVPATGVSTLDISLIRRHVLSIATLDTPYKMLAADVNGSRSITTLDISSIRRLILGSTNTFPAGLWRFVPSNYTFPDAETPWDAPSTRTLSNVSQSSTNQDFVAIKLGDVNTSWAPSASFAPLAKSLAQVAKGAVLGSGPRVTFRLSSHTNMPGENFSAAINVTNFKQVTSAQFTLTWDPEVLCFKSTGKYGLPGLADGNFNTNLCDTGRLTFSWDDPAAAGVTLPDGSVMFSVEFSVVGALGDVSPLSLNDHSTAREVGVNFEAAVFESLDGQFVVPNPPPSGPRLFEMSRENGVFRSQLQTEVGKRYFLEYSDSLPGNKWVSMPPVDGDGTVKLLIDPDADKPQRFYRIRVE